MILIRHHCLAWAFVLLASPVISAAEPAAKEAGPISYYRQVRPLFQQHCQGCHQPAKAQGSYIMTGYADLLKAGEKEKPGIVPGQPEKSVVIEQIVGHDGKPPAMPKGKDPLLDRDVQLIRQWISQGAKDDTPKSAREVVDKDHPPTYSLPPVITALDYSPDGAILAVSGYHEVLLHRADGSEILGRLIGLSERVQALSFSPDGKFLAVAGGSPSRFGEVQVWEIASQKLKLSVAVTHDTLYGVAWSPDSSKLAFGCGDNTLRAIDVATGKQVLYQGAHNDWVLGTVFSQDGTYLVSVSRDRTMKLTEVATQRMIDNITSITPGALKGGLAAVALRPMVEKKMSKVPPDTPKETPKPYDELLTGGADGVPRLYKMHREAKRVIGDDFNKVRDFEGLPGRIFAARFNADGKLFIVASSADGKGEVRVYQTDNGQRLSRNEGTYGPIYAVAFRPDGEQTAAAGFDGTVRLSDPKTGKLIKEFVPVPVQNK